MKKIALSILAVGIILLSSCASGVKSFKEPTTGDTMLVVGRVLVEDNYFSQEIGVYKASIEVAVLGKTDAGKEVGFWTITDKEGYFALGDVPKGEYVIKGIRAMVGRGSQVTITNRLRLSTDPYSITKKASILFDGNYFPYEANGRILSLQQNIFRLDQMSNQTNQVNYQVRFKLEDFELVDGTTLNDDSVENYYLQKYPDTSWKSELEASAKIQKFRR